MPEPSSDWLKFGKQTKYKRSPRFQAPKLGIFHKLFARHPVAAPLGIGFTLFSLQFSRLYYEVYQETKHTIKYFLGHYDHLGSELEE